MTGGCTIQKQMGEFHKWTAHKIIGLMQHKGDKTSLGFFKAIASGSRDRAHRIWDDAIARPVLTERYLIEVLEYIHNNPCKPPWDLAYDRSEYRYSSARYYDRGEESLIPVEDIRQFWDSLV